MIRKLLDELRRAWSWLFAPRTSDADRYAMPPYGWWDSDAVEDDIEPIRGRVWDQEDIEDLGGIDEGWPDD